MKAALNEALNDHPSEADVLITEFVGIGRYLVTDPFFNRVVFKAVGWAVEEFQEAVASAVELAGALGTMVDHLVLALVRERESAIGHDCRGAPRTSLQTTRVASTSSRAGRRVDYSEGVRLEVFVRTV
jgi:hypothetical protein